MEQTFPQHVDLPPLHWVKVYWKEPSAFIDDEHSRECTMFHFGIYRHSWHDGFRILSFFRSFFLLHNHALHSFRLFILSRSLWVWPCCTSPSWRPIRCPALISALKLPFLKKKIIGHFLSTICPFENWNSWKIDENLKRDDARTNAIFSST